MKKILILALGAVAVVACKQQGPKTEDLMMAQQADSLNLIIQQKDNEINDMMATFNEIEEGFRAINAAQDRVTLAKDGEGANRTQRIRDNIAQIQETMQHNRELINKLKNQLRQSSVKGDELRKTIENLVAQMEEKDKEINQLKLDLKSREQHIIEDGKVLQSNFNREYFTKIDIRVDKEIKLYSRSAKLLTAHPASSYVLERDANKQYVLRITNPQIFWSTSKYLVILVS